MLLLDNTKKNQSALAQYCRTGENPGIKGVNEKNLPHYRRLIYNVFESNLSSAYPLTKKLLQKVEWNGLVSDFVAYHASITPQVWYMPKEFAEYVRNDEFGIIKKYRFLPELLLFEWLEVEIYMMEDIHTDYSDFGDIEKDKLVLNPEMHLQHFSYPVHKKNAGKITEEEKGNYFLSLHRQPGSGKVLFTALSPVLLRILEYLSSENLNLNDISEKLKIEFNISFNGQIKNGLISFINNSLKSRLILGFES